MITWTAALAISRRKIAELRPDTQAKVRAWFNECLGAGLLPYVYEGQRSCERQNELYAQGRTKKGKIVTNAKAGQSMHQYGLAIDFVCLTPNAKAAGFFDAAWSNKKLYDRAHAIAAKNGLRRLSWETPHLEDASFKNWQAARAAFGNPCA
jgi:hypothetical protein